MRGQSIEYAASGSRGVWSISKPQNIDIAHVWD